MALLQWRCYLVSAVAISCTLRLPEDSDPDSNYIPDCLPEPAATAPPGSALQCSVAGIAPQLPPVGRVAIAYDSARERVVLFGGLGHPSSYTWEFDGQTWVAVQTAERPDYRTDASFVYHPARQACVLFGGQGSNGALMDTWEYDGGSWSRIAVAAGPARTAYAATVYDSWREEMVVALASGHDETWAYGSGGWREVEVGGMASRYNAGAAFDTVRGYTLLYGGLPSGCEGYKNDTWRLSNGTWTQLNAEHRPAAGGDWSAYFDPVRETVVIIRGSTADGSGAWEFDGTDWVQVTLETPQPLGVAPPVVWDALRRQLIILDHEQTLLCEWR